MWENGQGGGGWGHGTEGGVSGEGAIGDGMKSWKTGHRYRFLGDWVNLEGPGLCVACRQRQQWKPGLWYKSRVVGGQTQEKE